MVDLFILGDAFALLRGAGACHWTPRASCLGLVMTTDMRSNAVMIFIGFALLHKYN